MDQAKTKLPNRYYQSTSHLTDSCYQLPTHITGVTCSGSLMSAAAFINVPDFPSDGNLKIQVLHQVLMKCKQLLADPTLNPRTGPNHRKWPLQLNVQADNAAHAIKNEKFIFFLVLLVHYGHFSKICLNFMITGKQYLNYCLY